MDNLLLMAKELLQFLLEEQQKIMIDTRKKGYSLQQVAHIFGTSKAVVYRLTKDAFPPDTKEETK